MTALPNPISLGATTSSSGASSSITLTTTAGVAIGDTILIAYGLYTVFRTLTSIVDSAGNTYVIDGQKAHSITEPTVAIAHAVATNILPAGGTITATFNGSAAGLSRALAAAKVVGVALTKDALNNGENSGASAYATSNFAAAAADELLWGAAYGNAAGSSTPGASITEAHDVALGGTLASGYRQLASAGNFAFSGTWSPAMDWVAIGASYSGPPAIYVPSLTSLQKVYDALPGRAVSYFPTFTPFNGTQGGNMWTCVQRVGTTAKPGTVFANPVASPGATCDRNTPGALILPPDPGAGHVFRIVKARHKTDHPTHQGTFAAWYLTDRLVECSFDASLSTVQTLNTVPLPSRAPANGVGVQLAFESFAAAPGTLSAPTILVTYTNDQGGTSTATVSANQNWNLNTPGSRWSVSAIAAGDQGIKSIQSIQITANPGATPGGMAVVLFEPILIIDSFWQYGGSGRGGELYDWLDLALPPVGRDACLEWIYMFNASNTWIYNIDLDLVID